MRLVYGVGINDMPGCKGREPLVYQTWQDMHRRCVPTYQSSRPTYKGCTVHKDWHLLSIFRAWFMERARPGFALDKDILVPGNKVYGPDTCAVVPPALNGILLACDATRGAWPIGVHQDFASNKKHPYVAQMRQYKKTVYLGAYKTPEEAHEAWRVAKRAYVKEVALRSFLANEIKTDVYLALVRRHF